MADPFAGLGAKQEAPAVGTDPFAGLGAGVEVAPQAAPDPFAGLGGAEEELVGPPGAPELDPVSVRLSEGLDAEVEALVTRMKDEEEALQKELDEARLFGPVPESPALRIQQGGVSGPGAAPDPTWGPLDAWDPGSTLTGKTPEEAAIQGIEVRAAQAEDPAERAEHKREAMALRRDIGAQRDIKQSEEFLRLKALGMSASEATEISNLVEEMGPEALTSWVNYDLPEGHPDRVSSRAAMVTKAYRDGLKHEALIATTRRADEAYSEIMEGDKEGWLDPGTEEGQAKLQQAASRIADDLAYEHRGYGPGGTAIGRFLDRIATKHVTNLVAREEEYAKARKVVNKAEKISEILGIPQEQVEAMALAKYVTEHAYTQLPNQEDYNLMAQGYTPPMAGGLTPGWKKATQLEKVLSWFSRPFYATVSASADLDYLFKMEAGERQAWIDNLHPKDPRGPIFEEIGGTGGQIPSIIEEQNRVEGLYDANVHARLMGLKNQLRKAYWDANALDPYGFNIHLPHPWQKIERGGIIAAGERLSGPQEIRSRGLAAKIWGSPIKTDDPAMMAYISKEEQRWMSHVDARWWGLGTTLGIDSKYYKGPPDPIAALFTPGAKRKDILKQIEEGDPLAGMWTANMFQIIAPDLAAPYEGVFAGAQKLLGAPKLKAGGSYFTSHGDRMRTAQQARQAQRVVGEMEQRALAAGRELSQSEKNAAMDLFIGNMDEVYNQVAALASAGAKYTPENLGKGTVALRHARGKGDPAWLEVKHIDFDEAIRFDEGVPYLDSTKILVTYGDDAIPSVGAVVDRIAAAGKGSPGAEAVRDFLYGKGAARKIRQRRGLIPEEAPVMVIPEGKAAQATRLQDQLDAARGELRGDEAHRTHAAGSYTVPFGDSAARARKIKKIADLEKKIERLKAPKKLTPDEVVDHMLAEMFDPLRPASMFPKKTTGNLFKVFDGAGRMVAQVDHAIFAYEGRRPMTDFVQRAFGVDSSVLGWNVNHGTKEAPNWKPAKLIDLITDQEAQRVVQGYWKQDIARRAIGSKFHKLAYDVMLAKGTKKEAELIGKFVEALGEPVDMADVGMSLLQGVTSHVSRGIQYRPVARTAARADIPPLPSGRLSKTVARHMIAENKAGLVAIRDLNIPASESFLEHGLTFTKDDLSTFLSGRKKAKPVSETQLDKALDDLIESGIVTKTDDGNGFRIKPEYYELPGKPKVEKPPTPAAAPEPPPAAAAAGAEEALAPVQATAPERTNYAKNKGESWQGTVTHPETGEHFHANATIAKIPGEGWELTVSGYGGQAPWEYPGQLVDISKTTTRDLFSPDFGGWLFGSVVDAREAALAILGKAKKKPSDRTADIVKIANDEIRKIEKPLGWENEPTIIGEALPRYTPEAPPASAAGIIEDIAKPTPVAPDMPPATATKAERDEYLSRLYEHRLSGKEGMDDAAARRLALFGEHGTKLETYLRTISDISSELPLDPALAKVARSWRSDYNKALNKYQKIGKAEGRPGQWAFDKAGLEAFSSKRVVDGLVDVVHESRPKVPPKPAPPAAVTPPVAPPVSAAGIIEDIAKPAKLKPRPTTAKLRNMREKLSRHKPALKEGRQFERPGIRDVRGADLERVPGPDILERPVLGMIEAEVGRAQIIRQTVKELLGVADADELRALRSIHDNIDRVVTKATKALDPAFVDDYLEALEGMSLADVRQSARALRRPTFDPAEYKNLSAAAKTAVEAIRDMQKMAFELLKLEGLLPKGRSLAWWYEKMQVEGYTHQMMTVGGFKKFSKLMTRKDPTAAAPLLQRTEKGILIEKEQRTQLGMAEMLWREKNPTFPAKEIPPLDELLHLVEKEGLDKIRYYEHQAHIVMKHYGDAISAGVAMQRFGRDMAKQFPKGDTFVGMLRGGRWKTMRNASGEMPKTVGEARQIVDLEATRAGYRKVDSVSYVRGVFEANAWEGWRTYEAQVSTLLKNSSPETAVDDVMRFFREQKIDVSDPIVEMQSRVLANELYLPNEVATFVEHMNKPDWLSDWRRLGPVQELVGGTFQDTLNFFKASVTVSAIAFHGRNALSNVVTTYIAHGAAALNPVRQMEMMWLLVAPEEITKFEIGLGRKAGPRTFTLNINDPVTGLKSKEVRTIREWKEKMRNVGVLMDDWNPSDIQLGFKRMKTGWVSPGYRSEEMRRAAKSRGDIVRAGRLGTPLVTTGIGAAAGGVIGYNMGPDDTPEGRKLVQAFAGVLMGGTGGAAPGAIYDLYMKEPLKAARGAFKPGQDLTGVVRAHPSLWGNTKAATSAALDVWLDSITTGSKPLSNVSRAERLAKGVTGSPATKVGLATGVAGAGFGALSPLAPDESRPERIVKNMLYGFLGGGGAAVAANSAFIVHAGVGVKIEEQAKAVGWFAGKAKGLSDDAAREIVDATIFNYFKLSPFEKNVMRRIFPFYTWSSKNIRLLQPYLLANEPKRYAAFQHVMMMGERGFSEKDDILFTPEHLQFTLAANMGKARIIARYGTPEEDIISMFRPGDLISRTHPATQILSRFLGHEMYYNVPTKTIKSGRDVLYLPRPFREFVGLKEVPTFEYKKGAKIPSGTKWEVGHFIGENGEPRYSNSLGTYRMAMLKSFPMWRLVTEYNKMIAERYLLGTSGEVGADPEPISWGTRALPVFTGIKLYDLNEAQERRNFWRGYNKTLWDAMGDMDQVGHRAYLRKNTKLTEADIDAIMRYGESEKARNDLMDQIMNIQSSEGATPPDAGFPVGPATPALPEK